MVSCGGSVTDQILSQTVATIPHATPSTNPASKIATAQNQLNLINSAVSAIQTYEQESNNYLALSQNTATTPAQLSAAQATLDAAKAQAVSVLQSITGSGSTDVLTLMSAVQQMVIQIVQDDARIQAQNMQASQTPTCPAATNTIQEDYCIASGTYNYLLQYCTLCAGAGGTWGGTSLTCP